MSDKLAADSRNAIRQDMRLKRTQLTLEQQEQAAQQLNLTLNEFIKEKQVAALYLANDGEISPNLAITQLQQKGVITLLPVMHSFNKGYLNFQQYTPHTPMVKNNFAILEPKLNATQTYSLAQIDYIFMPLVAFDVNGNRLGMGGGFYDRTLSKMSTLNKKPKLIGLAHDCQKVEKLLPIEPWDIPLDLIITPSKTVIVKN